MFGIAWCSKSGGRRSGEGQRCQKIGGEDQEGGDGSQIFEEPAAGAHLLHRLAPEIFDQITDDMEGESQKVQGHEHGGKIDFLVPEVVFEMVAVVLQDVEAFILDFPAHPATGGEVDHRVGRDVEVGDETVAVCDGAGGVDDLDHESVDGHGISIAAQWDVAQPAVAVVEAPARPFGGRLRPQPAGLEHWGEFLPIRHGAAPSNFSVTSAQASHSAASRSSPPSNSAMATLSLSSATSAPDAA